MKNNYFGQQITHQAQILNLALNFLNDEKIFNNLSFNAFNKDSNSLLAILTGVFYPFAMEHNMSEETLYKFFNEVKNEYEKHPVTFHNFYKSMNTVYYTNLLLRNNDLTSSLSSFQKMALLFASLFSNLGHRGYTNDYEIQSASEMAMLYSN